MTTDFERSKEVVCGRSVMITSWYDDVTHSWRAGAPTYPFVSTSLVHDESVYSSRKSAIDRTVSLLMNRFRLDDAEPEPA